jgi:hypothetical protein
MNVLCRSFLEHFKDNLYFKNQQNCTKQNTIQKVTKHASYQVLTPICVGTLVQLSGSLSKTKACRSTHVQICVVDELPVDGTLLARYVGVGT